MSLSTCPDYLARHGIRAQDGPLNGQIVDDGSPVWRHISMKDGAYDLKGQPDGGLVYVWDGDLERRSAEYHAWNRWSNMRMKGRWRRSDWKWRRRNMASLDAG